MRTHSRGPEIYIYPPGNWSNSTMNLPDDISLSDLDGLVIPGSANRIAGRLGVMATVYFTSPHEPEMRRKVGQAVDLLLRRFGPFYRWRQDAGQGRVVSTEGWSPPSYSQSFAALDRRQPVELELHGGEKPEDAAQFALSCLAQAYRPRPKIGYLTVSASFAWVQDQKPEALQTLFFQICSVIKPLHGYSGFGILRNPNYAVARKAETYILDLARRFSGLELDQPIDHAANCRDGIKGVNWLTALATTLIERLGGARELARSITAADHGLVWTDFEGGGILQAGETPQLGDLTRNIVPSAYGAAQILLNPVHDDVIIAERIPGLDRKRFTRAWLDRFTGGRP